MATVALPELDWFGVAPQQHQVEKEIETIHRPYSAIKSGAPLEFIVTTADDESLLLRELYLNLQLQYTLSDSAGDGALKSQWDKLAPVNFILHSLFKAVELEINDVNVTRSQHTYAYKAVLNGLIGYSSDARTSILTAAGWKDDEWETAKADIPNATRSGWFLPSGANESNKIKDSKIAEFRGKLFIDLATSQSLALFPGTKIKVTLIPNTNSAFYSMLGGNLEAAEGTRKAFTADLSIKQAYLQAARWKLSKECAEAHWRTLARSPACYPYTRSEVKVFTLAKDQRSMILDNCTNGRLPRRCIIGFVKHSAFNGSYSENPFQFTHHKLSNLCVRLDGVQYPAQAFEPDFTNGFYMREFLSVPQAFNTVTSDNVIMTNRASFPNKMLLGINFANDTSDGFARSGHVNPPTTGSMRIDVQFKDNLSDNIALLLYVEYDSTMLLDINKNVAVDF